MVKYNPYLRILIKREEILLLDKAQREHRNHMNNKIIKVE